MKAQEFFNLVGLMRNAQKRYFKERTIDALTLSKRLERDVDKAIAYGLDKEPEEQQPTLFDPMEPGEGS